MNLSTKRVHLESGMEISTLYTDGTSTELPIIFLHGWGGSARSYIPLIESFLSEVGVKHPTLYAFDLPGFGESSLPPTAWTIQDYASCVAQCMDALHIDRAHIVCHSFGGRITAVLLTSYINRFSSATCIAPAGVYHSSLKARVAGSLSLALAQYEKIPTVKRMLSPVRFFLRRILGARDYAATSGVMKETFQQVIAADIAPLLPQVTQSVQLFFGQHDTYVPISDAKIWHNAIQKSMLTIFPDGKHGLQYTHTATIARELSSFLKSL